MSDDNLTMDTDVLLAKISVDPDNKILQKEFKMVLVTWGDTEHMGGWHDKLELLDYVEKPCITMKSVGWLIYNGYDHVVLAMTCGENNSGELLKIPWPMISDMRTVPDDNGDVYRYPSPEFLRKQAAKGFSI